MVPSKRRYSRTRIFTTAKIVDGILLREHNTNKGSLGIIVDIGADIIALF